MGNIIEKLGIKTPDRVVTASDVWKVFELAKMPPLHISSNLFFPYGFELKKILDERNEMLAALIDIIKFTAHGKNNPEGCHCRQCNGIRVIEKACYPKEWPEINELSNA